jgi:hypothetical protein
MWASIHLLKSWTLRHGAILSTGANLPLITWLTNLTFSKLVIPIECLLLTGIIFLFIRPTNTKIGINFLLQLVGQARAQIIAITISLGIGHFIWSWPWTTFIPLISWVALPIITLKTYNHIQSIWRYNQLVVSFIRKFNDLFFKIASETVHRSLDTAITCSIIIWAISFLAERFEPSISLDFFLTTFFPLTWLVLDLMPYARWQFATGPIDLLIRYFLRLLAWDACCITLIYLSNSGLNLKIAAWLLIANLALATYAFTHLKGVVKGAENLRRCTLAACVFWIAQPYATHALLGGGDALWYANTLADFLAQIKAGIFPVFVGQSEYLFNGGVFPIRFAPLFQHYGIAVNAITLGSLNPAGLQNMIIIGSLFAAAFSTYYILRRLLPQKPNIALVLCVIYLSCPGLLALAFYGDLMMSWTTLPWLTLAFGASIMTFHEKGIAPYFIMSLALSLIWWGHSPIALWSSLAVGFVQLTRITTTSEPLKEWRNLILGGTIFVLIILYPITSILGVPINPGSSTADYSATKPVEILNRINESFPAILAPLDPKKPSLAYYQTGWSILLLTLSCIAIGLHRRITSRGFWATIATSLVLLLFLLPIPFLNSLIWNTLPGFLRNPTGNWPMQRFNVIIAASAVCAAAYLIALLKKQKIFFPIWPIFLLLTWSLYESKTLVDRRDELRKYSESKPSSLLPQNNYLTRNAYLVFEKFPSYFSHGHVEPLLENRLLKKKYFNTLTDNTQAVILPQYGATLIKEGNLAGALKKDENLWDILPSFQIDPLQRYAIEINFHDKNIDGTLLLKSDSLNLIYGLPIYGGIRSFGSTAQSNHLITISTQSLIPENLKIRFVASDNFINSDYSNLGYYRWFKINLQELPIKVTNWIPYSADIQSSEEAWLETPRMFQPGYEATVDGKFAKVSKSPEGLVMISVPEGKSRVTVFYRPPFLLITSYWISFGTILLSAFVIIIFFWRSALDRKNWENSYD